MPSFKTKDIITFSDGHKVYVLDSIIYNSKEYLFTDDFLPDGSSVKNKYSILYANYETGEISPVTDKETIMELAPIFEENIEKQIDQEFGNI